MRDIEKFKCSDNVKIVNGKGPLSVVLYHKLNLAKIYGDDDLLKIFNSFRTPKSLDDVLKQMPASKEILTNLVKNDFIIKEELTDTDIEDKIRKKWLSEKPRIRVMYIYPTNRCNFRCKYCSVECGKPENFVFSSMKKELAEKSLEIFSHAFKETGKGVKPVIYFYGGEPLINEDVVRFTVEQARKLEKSGYFGKKGLELYILTNGSLLKENMVDFLIKQGVTLSISLDGMKKHHDKMRVYQNGSGTWNDVIKAFRITKKAGISPGISCTVGSHNVMDLDKIAEYFVNDLEAQGVGLNFLMGIGKESDISAPADIVSEKIIEAFKIFRRHGTYEDRVMRRVKAFVQERPRLKDCAGFGGELAFSPLGDIGPCHILLERGEFIIGNVNDTEIKSKIANSEILKSWAKITPLNNEKCKGCEAIGVCGGACVYSSYVKTGKLDEIDDFVCHQYKFMLNWMIEDLREKLIGEMKS